MKDRLCVWFHASSVGEVVAVGSILSSVRRNYPEAEIVLSTITKSGMEIAKKMIKEVNRYIYFPLDFLFSVKMALKAINPDIFILTETDIWPNFLKIAKKRKVKIITVNGRLSSRSIKKYRATKFLWKKVLENIDIFSMISKLDAQRVISLGAGKEKVFINGNTKYDSLLEKVNPEYEGEIRKCLDIKGEKIFVAGSIREGEEKLIIEAYLELLKEFKGLILIIVPRHIERKKVIGGILKNKGISYILKTEINKGKARKNEGVIIIDTIGELFKVYSVATIVFCGGSLLPYGGQNILEPAVWGKAVFYGPSMDDFLGEKEILEEVGAGMEVENINEFIRKAREFLKNPEELERRGKKGKEIILLNRGAAKKNTDLIRKLIDQKMPLRGNPE